MHPTLLLLIAVPHVSEKVDGQGKTLLLAEALQHKQALLHLFQPLRLAYTTRIEESPGGSNERHINQEQLSVEWIV